MLHLDAPEELEAALQSGLSALPAAPLTQLSLEIAPLDLLAWLQGQDEMLQFYWTSRKRAFQVAAIGAVKSWTELAELEQELDQADLSPTLRCYGGWRFNADSQPRSPWLEWPASYFFLPRWELRCERGYYCICLNLIGPRSSWQAQLSAALELLRPPVSLPAELPALGPLSHEPAQARWREEIQEAQRLFAGSELRKLVLSRKSSARLEALPLTLMQRLLEQGREAYHFWFRPFASQVLWGASPERLYARTGTTLWTEALAGTRQRSQVPSEQAALRLELLGSHKEFEENERVRQHLEAALEPLATGLKAEPLRVIPAGPVQHLYRCMQAELNPGVSDTRLVAALHPTPAVSGFPSRTAQALLAGLESHSRGWYTGAMGWISPQASEWAVLLRCALWQGQGQEIHFFTGAGIMPASRPEAEWQELDLKLSSLLSLWD